MIVKLLLLYLCLSVSISGTYVFIFGLIGKIRNDEVWRAWGFGVLLWPLRLFGDLANAVEFLCGGDAD